MADWSKILSRGDVEDRRGAPLAIGGGLGLAGVIVTLIFSFLGGGAPPDMEAILSQLQAAQTTQNLNAQDFEGADDYEKFAATVLGSNNDVWRGIFQQSNRTYTEPKLVLFRAATQSGCGLATSDVGPHYCPPDATIYLDETFFDELQQRFKAKGGDVAQAYVIAHEVGHHVQNQLGIMDRVDRSGGSNADSIKLELQADCFAGIWAKSVSNVFEPGEVNEALDAAAAVGDDHIQETVQGRVNPETWTHGSSQQRVEWFNKGYNGGTPAACDTFQ